jgi:glycosyltransferase involved in cell wall biosynthesis
MKQINKTLLTIAIPTYNSLRTLKETLNSVANQNWTGVNNDLIEVLVSDNASSDGTENHMQSLINNYPIKFRYHRNEKNIGYDKNIDQIVKSSNGTYVKILCDDDALYLDAIQTYVNLITSVPEFNICITNFNIYDLKLFNCITKSSKDTLGTILCDNQKSFLKYSNGKYGQTSSLLVNKNAWVDIPGDSLYDSFHIQVWKSLHLSENKTNIIQLKPTVKVRTGSPNFSINEMSKFLVPMKGLDVLKKYYSRVKKSFIKNLISKQTIYVTSAMRTYHLEHGLSDELIEVHNQLTREISLFHHYRKKI